MPFSRHQLAIERELPLLGICRGIQALNVALGGTLVQDIPAQVPAALVHQSPQDAPIATHPVRLQPDSRLAALIQCTDLLTNSSHHQAIQSLAPSLRAVGWSQDGVVEAVESTDQAFVIGVQWHPELLFQNAAPHRRLFVGLVEACTNQMWKPTLSLLKKAPAAVPGCGNRPEDGPQSRLFSEEPPFGELDIEDLINPEEIAELARRYGPIERRSYVLETGKEHFEYWREALAKKRRSEVVLVVQRPDGVILHTKDYYPPGTYRLPSGGVKWGESVLSALHREAREEMGLAIEAERFLGLLEYELRCEEQTLPFVSYVFLVRGNGGELIPQDETEHILSFRQVSVADLSAVADSLRALKGNRRDWGEFRAIAHDFVVEMLVLSLSKQWKVPEMTMALQRYVDRRIPSQLRQAFEEMMSTATGSRLAESSARRRARYVLDPTGKLGGASMTVNLVRLVVIGKGSFNNTPWLINSLAHEATHIEQKYISDSFEQEYVAFTTAAQVMTELGLPDSWGWDAPELQSLSPEEAARQIMEFYPNHPLYGMNPAIPVYQVQGLRGLVELAKQAWALLRAA